MSTEHPDRVVLHSLSEAVAFIDREWPNMRAEVTKHGPVAYHDSMGRYIRNLFGLWYPGPLHDHMKEKWGIAHPDDMSNRLLEEWVAWLQRTNPPLPTDPSYQPPWIEPPTQAPKEAMALSKPVKTSSLVRS